MGKSGMKGGQKSRAPEMNEKAIGELLAAFRAEMNAADESGKSYVPDPHIAICRIQKAESSEWFQIVTRGRTIRVTGDGTKNITSLVWELCRHLAGVQPGSKSWPVVVVSLPKPHAKKQTGEMLAVLSLDRDEPQLQLLLAEFKALGHIMPGADEDDVEGAAAGGGGGFCFTEEGENLEDDEVNIDAI